MKKTIMAVALTATLSANAGFFNENNSWDNPWNNNTTAGNAQDNGIFKYNAYDMWDPRWFAKETENMFNKIDEEFGNEVKNPWTQTQYETHGFPVKASTK